MKHSLLFLVFVIGIFFSGCNHEEVYEFHFQASVTNKGMDCGETYLIQLTNLSGDSKIEDGIFYADNLAEEFKEDGLTISLNCRMPEANEIGACSTMGPAYPHVYVVEAQKIE